MTDVASQHASPQKSSVKGRRKSESSTSASGSSASVSKSRRSSKSGNVEMIPSKKKQSIGGTIKKLAAKTLKRFPSSESLKPYRPEGSEGNHTSTKRKPAHRRRLVHFDMTLNETIYVPPNKNKSGKTSDSFMTAKDFSATITHAQYLCKNDGRVADYIRSTAEYYNHVCLGGPPLQKWIENEHLRQGLSRGYRGLEHWSDIGKYRRTRIATVVIMLVKAQFTLEAECHSNGYSRSTTKRHMAEKLREFSMRLSEESCKWALRAAADDALAAQEEYGDDFRVPMGTSDTSLQKISTHSKESCISDSGEKAIVGDEAQVILDIPDTAVHLVASADASIHVFDTSDPKENDHAEDNLKNCLPFVKALEDASAELTLPCTEDASSEEFSLPEGTGEDDNDGYRDEEEENEEGNIVEEAGSEESGPPCEESSEEFLGRPHLEQKAAATFVPPEELSVELTETRIMI
jgi:hypothetical protein